MADGSSIEWCDATWQPVLGCTRVSAGCDHCYAINVVHRGMSPQHRGLTKVRPKDASRPGLDWAGDIRLQPDRLAEPLHWRKSRRVFVCSLADLFHPGVPLEYVAAVFGVMAACPQHTFLVLTKRPARAREFFRWMHVQPRKWPGETDAAIAVRMAEQHEPVGPIGARDVWPLPNVHLGTSVEDQATADERVPLLLACPAAVHWVSAEPLLGPLDLAAANVKRPMHAPQLAWVVVGGESGRGARMFEIAWARRIVDDCKRAGVPVFVKQLGARPRQPASDVEPGGLGTWTLELRDRKGGDMHEWPADLRVRELPR